MVRVRVRVGAGEGWGVEFLWHHSCSTRYWLGTNREQPLSKREY